MTPLRRDRIWVLVARHVGSNTGLYMAGLLFVILGVALGLAAVGVLSPLQKADLLQYLGGFLTSLRDGQAIGPGVMRVALSDNLHTALVAFLLGVTVIGLPALAFLLVLRGFVIGFTSGFLAGELGLKGYVLIAAGVIPPNLILVPAYAVLGVAAFRFAGSLVKSRLSNGTQVIEAGLRFGAVAAGVAVVAIVAAALEAYVSPFLLSALWPYVGGG